MWCGCMRVCCWIECCCLSGQGGGGMFTIFGAWVALNVSRFQYEYCQPLCGFQWLAGPKNGSWAHFPVGRESWCNLSIQIESSRATACRLHPSLRNIHVVCFDNNIGLHRVFIMLFLRVFFCYLSISMFYTYLFRGLCYPYWHIRKTHLQTFMSINVIVGHTKLCQCSARLYYCHRRNWSFLHSCEIRTPMYDGLSTWCTLCKRIQ